MHRYTQESHLNIGQAAGLRGSARREICAVWGWIPEIYTTSGAGPEVFVQLDASLSQIECPGSPREKSTVWAALRNWQEAWTATGSNAFWYKFWCSSYFHSRAAELRPWPQPIRPCHVSLCIPLLGGLKWLLFPTSPLFPRTWNKLGNPNRGHSHVPDNVRGSYDHLIHYQRGKILMFAKWSHSPHLLSQLCWLLSLEWLSCFEQQFNLF